MAKRRRNAPEEPREETRKQTRMRLRDQERNRRMMMIVGGALTLALLLVIAGVISEVIIKPGSVLARVEGQPIVTRDFWERARLRKGELQNQLQQLQIFSQQFGDQNVFASQMSQIQATLSSPLSLGTQVINEMIEEQVVRLKAGELGVTVSDEEVEEALREEIALGQGAVTAPQATATAEAGVAATATAETFTPTPTLEAAAPLTDTETLTGTETLTTTETITGAADAPAEPPTPEPPTILTDEQYQEGLQTLADNLREQTGLTLDEYREVIRTQLLTEKLQEVIGEERVEATEEQIHVRHILIRVDETEPLTPTQEITETQEITASEGFTSTPAVAPAAEVTATQEITAGEEITSEAEVAPAAAVTATQEITASEVVTSEPDIAAGEEITGTEMTDSDAPPVAETRDDAEALALAQSLRERLLAGEDFAELAQVYSDDPGSAVEGGDLGWVGRGAFVAEFEEAAFALPVGEISEPIRTEFGYHLIEVLERDENRPKDESQLLQERAQAFDAWIQEQILTLDVERPEDLPSKLPSDL